MLLILRSVAHDNRAIASCPERRVGAEEGQLFLSAGRPDDVAHDGKEVIRIVERP
jgi:hypothetical protein